MQKILLLLGITLVSMVGFSQQDTTMKGKFRVFTNTKKAIIRIDTSKINFGEFYTLDTGKLVIKAWAPGRELVEKQVILRNDRIYSYRVGLPYTEAFKKYRWKNRQYEFKKNALRYGPMSLYGAFAVTRLLGIIQSNQDANKALERAEENKRVAENSFWVQDVEKNREEFILNKNKHDKAVEKVNKSWKDLQVGLGATVIVNYLTWKLATKLKKPVYHETPLLSRVLIVPSIQPNLTAVHLALNF